MSLNFKPDHMYSNLSLLFPFVAFVVFMIAIFATSVAGLVLNSNASNSKTAQQCQYFMALSDLTVGTFDKTESWTGFL